MSPVLSPNPDVAELLGAMTGDKRLFKKTRRYDRRYSSSKKQVRHVLSICLGGDKDWGQRLSGIVYREVGVRGSIYWDRDEWFFYTTSASLFTKLSQYYLPRWNARKWRVSPAIRSSSNEVKRRFVRGYFDADGYPYFHKARNRVVVKVNSVNNRGLKDMKRLLESLSYHPGLYRRYKRRAVWEVTIQRKQEVIRFFNEVGFSIARKQNKLLKMLKRKWPDEFR